MTNEQIIIDAAIIIFGQDAVMEMLAEGKEIPLHTIAGWKSRGNYRVIKGEHGFETRLWKKRRVKSVEGNPYEEFYKAKAYLFTHQEKRNSSTRDFRTSSTECCS